MKTPSWKASSDLCVSKIIKEIDQLACPAPYIGFLERTSFADSFVFHAVESP